MNTAERRRAWVKAGAVVGSLAVCGFIAGRSIGIPATGAVGGILLGMSINKHRRCPVCMEHMQTIQRIVESSNA